MPPTRRRSKIDIDAKRYINVEGDPEDDFEIVRRSDKNSAGKRYIIIQGDSPDDFEIV